MASPDKLFQNAITWLRENYGGFRFYMEREIVWLVQTQIVQEIEKQTLPLKVVHNYKIVSNRTSYQVDLAILNSSDFVEVAAEFKFEPSHSRKDLIRTKLPLAFWNDKNQSVLKDVERVREIVEDKKARIAYSVFIDEGGYYRNRAPSPGSGWMDWHSGAGPSNSISVLWSKVVALDVDIQ